MSNEERPAEPARTPRMIRLKVALWVVVVLIIAAAAIWGWKSLVCSSALYDRTEQFARTLATAIAAFGNKDVAAKNYSDLQRYSDDLVQQKLVSFVAIVDSRGRVVVHTNRAYLGRSAKDLTTPSGVVEGSAKVMGVTQQVGTVLVGLKVK